MKEFKFNRSGKEHSAHVVEHEETLEVTVDGKIYTVTLPERKPAAKPVVKPAAPAAAPAPAAGGAGMQVKSPLPGTVLDVMVREGDTVTAGQHIILLEAMKMENNIEAPKAGKVTNIRVKQRDAVMEGDVLLTIE